MGPHVSSRNELLNVSGTAFGTFRWRVFGGKKQLFKLAFTVFTYVFEYGHWGLPLIPAFFPGEYRESGFVCQVTSEILQSRTS